MYSKIWPHYLLHRLYIKLPQELKESNIKYPIQHKVFPPYLARGTISTTDTGTVLNHPVTALVNYNWTLAKTDHLTPPYPVPCEGREGQPCGGNKPCHYQLPSSPHFPLRAGILLSSSPLHNATLIGCTLLSPPFKGFTSNSECLPGQSIPHGK